jgi:hypothetical protein
MPSKILIRNHSDNKGKRLSLERSLSKMGSPRVQYELAPKNEEDEKEEVVVSSKTDYSKEFKELVLSMMSYHFYDRPSV